MTVLDIVKIELPNTTLTDEQIYFRIEEVAQAIMNYCNRGDIPSELKFVQAKMVVDLISSKEKSSNQDSNLVAKSIKEGDVQVTFENGTVSLSEASTDDILHNYESQLNKFRKLRW